MTNPLELSNDFQYALDVLEKTNKNLFITGRAGTGKSTLLQLFKNTTHKKIVVLAPTGVAALNVGGQTIHSFFGFPAKFFAAEDIKVRKNAKMYQKMEVLVIDEISMVRADLIDNIDRFLRINRRNNQPFGGVQLVCFGDLFQLPPVLASGEEQHYFTHYYESPYFFSAKVFTEDKFELEGLELNKVYRQEARHFVRLLDAVRTGTIDFDDLEDLNSRYQSNYEPTGNFITLSTRNNVVDTLNARALMSLGTEEFRFLAEVTGDFDEKLYPAEGVLKLKLGAQVMFVRNDPKREYVNGTIGTIIKLENAKIVVRIEERDNTTKDIEVEKATWENYRYQLGAAGMDIEAKSVGEFKQYPLRLAWAMTIHKSQGKTFDKVIIDLAGGAFEFGQTYVALSRCRTLSGIVLKNPIRPTDIKIDERIIHFYEQNF